MRNTEASGRMVRNGPGAPRRGVRLAIVALGIGLVMTTGAARAQSEDEETKTFQEKMMESIMAGIGGTNMDNRGINYRERSPLVVPPRIDLPPPVVASKEVKDPNWPKDPDEARRKAAIARRKKENKVPVEAARPLTPGELQQPGEPAQNSSSSPLGIDKLTHLFGGTKTEAATFTGEPARDALTQPPPGYQTPSPNFVYGTGPKESMKKETSPAQDKDANPAPSKNGG